MIQNENARTTGAPIFFQLSELDDLDPIQPCLEYLERMRAAGNHKMRLAVYAGVYHSKENVAGIARESGRHTPNCRFFSSAERRLIDRKTGQQVPRGKEWAYIYPNLCHHRPLCHRRRRARVKAQATAGLLQFLRDVDIVMDSAARCRSSLHGHC